MEHSVNLLINYYLHKKKKDNNNDISNEYTFTLDSNACEWAYVCVCEIIIILIYKNNKKY